MKNNQVWQQVADDVFWYRGSTELQDSSNPTFYRWYADGVTSACFSALDIHVERGRGDQTALIYDSPVTQKKRRMTYSAILDDVSQLAGVLVSQGVGKGGRVIIYLPMVPDTLIANMMLLPALIVTFHAAG